MITLVASLADYFRSDALLATWEGLLAAVALSLAGPLALFISSNIAIAVVTIFGLLQKMLPR